jgi:hypothetical protein
LLPLEGAVAAFAYRRAVWHDDYHALHNKLAQVLLLTTAAAAAAAAAQLSCHRGSLVPLHVHGQRNRETLILIENATVYGHHTVCTA